MLRDRLFFPIAMLIIGMIIYLALLPGSGLKLKEEEILRNGYLAEAQDLAYIQASPGTSSSYVGATGAEVAHLELSAHLSRELAPPSAGVFAPLNSEYEKYFAEKNLRITLTARQGDNNPVDEFRMGYFTAGPGDSGWKVFQLTPEYKDYSFTFTPKLPIDDPDLDYFGVWPDEEGEQRTMNVSRFRIEVLN